MKRISLIFLLAGIGLYGSLQAQSYKGWVSNVVNDLQIYGSEYWLPANSSAGAIRTALQNGYDIIHIPPGTYNSGQDSLAIRNQTNFKLIGSGIGKTIFTGTNWGLFFSKCDTFSVEGMSFRNTSQTPFFADTCTFIEVKNCEFSGSSANNGATFRESSWGSVHDNIAFSNNQHGIELNNADYFSFYSNKLFQNDNKGIETWTGSSFVSIFGNTTWDNAAGIYVYSSEYVSVSSNTCLNDSLHGILIELSKNTSVVGNAIDNISGSSTNGVRIIVGSDSTVVIGNTIRADTPINDSGSNTVYWSRTGGIQMTGNIVNSGNFYVGPSVNNGFRFDTGQGPFFNSAANFRVNIDTDNGEADGSRSIVFAQNDPLTSGTVFAEFLDSGDAYLKKGLTLGSGGSWVTFNDAATRLVVIGTDTMAYAGIQPNSFSAPRDAMWVNTTGDTLFFKINGSTFHVLLTAGGGH